MILSYKTKRVEAFASGERVREFSGFDRQGWKRLEILDAATSLEDLRALPSNRLESLAATGRASSASASTCNGGFASSGQKARLGRRTWISSITLK